ncbi:MAG: orotidine-5'-phosphate decarboxylase [Bdellovibrionales bacterium]|nr:orotidine-5'-phosphate decarboxylase [Bdellovibrionales bacterium]
MNFADLLHESSTRNNSFLIAGFDPRIEKIPSVFKSEASNKSKTNEDLLYHTLVDFHLHALETIGSQVAAIKPNIAFFEQHGLAGLRAFSSILSAIREYELPVVIDAKRGDIGSTADAYAKAYLGANAPFPADALTVNPFLGFDTIESFLKACEECGKGIFVLVKTSNPGSGDLQNQHIGDGCTISERIADWLSEHSSRLQGSCGYSGLGAVIGATYPHEAKAMRERMPNNFFLIPGLGSQGGSADDAIAGFGEQNGAKGGAIINVSRGLLSSFSDLALSKSEVSSEIAEKLSGFQDAVHQALLKS